MSELVTVDKEELRKYVNDVLSEGDEQELTDEELEMCERCLIDAASEFGFDAIWDVLEEREE
ncbi:hypothetical protein LCGC14_1758840 [marine sediment metagenome]|uniref:Uncharacterized protein n=1 Tax=marine sediment metagenome TaxID=412755 RepID=A0A0F9K199_9ZZZZ